MPHTPTIFHAARRAPVPITAVEDACEALDSTWAGNRYFGHWLLISGRGRVPGTFASPDYSFHDHFRRTGPELYEPEPEWGEKGFPPLDWAAIRSQYQYVILAGDAAPAVALVEEGARPVSRSGGVTVYRVEPAAPPTALTRAAPPPGRTAGERGTEVSR